MASPVTEFNQKYFEEHNVYPKEQWVRVITNNKQDFVMMPTFDANLVLFFDPDSNKLIHSEVL